MEELLAVLEAPSLPVAYGKWEVKPPEPPYVVYRYVSSADLMADGLNYHAIGDWQVELYAERKDSVAEAALEAALVTAGLPFQKFETYIEPERLYQVVYLIRTI